MTRAFLRHDPDIVMIGEIRDQETAREAIRAALTGRKVLSTLHTQNSIGAVPRLLELGVEPGLLAETLIGVIAQRLVRLRCCSCASRQIHGNAGDADCPSCRSTGDAGRTMIAEVLTVNSQLRALIERRPSTEEIRELAEREGFSTLADDALQLVATGGITLKEAERVLGPLSGTPDAVRRDAQRQVRAQGLTPIQVDPDPIRTFKAWIHPTQLSVRGLADAFGFLAESSELDLPLADVLVIAERSANDKRLKEHLAASRAFLVQGASFSHAVERAGGMPIFAIQLLRTAEESGSPGALAEAFRSLRDHYRLHADFNRRTRKAIVQPAITALIVFAVVVFVVTVLVPRLRPLFALFKDLPWLARAVFGVADMVSGHTVLSAAVSLTSIALAWSHRAALIAALPGVKPLLAAIGGFQICTALGLLLRSGFPAARALVIVGAGLEGELGKRVARAATRIGHGTPLSAALAGVGLKRPTATNVARSSRRTSGSRPLAADRGSRPRSDDRVSAGRSRAPATLD